MNRPAWRSGKGEPFALAELAVIYTLPAALVGLTLGFMGCDPVTVFVVIATVYLTMERVAIIVDWVREVRTVRRADRAFLAELAATPGPASMATRAPVG